MRRQEICHYGLLDAPIRPPWVSMRVFPRQKTRESCWKTGWNQRDRSKALGEGWE
jgi:hypothetical protein